tara:strand:+ start:304 stop:483 length:180 start_codon:yes stop_codon:yes gene_type:complete
VLRKLKSVGVGYLAFGLGTIFGSIIASIVGTLVYQVVSGNEHAAKILKITECLEERAEK